MNKVFSLIAFCIFSVLTVNAQTLNDRILKASKWERLDNDKTYTVQCDFDSIKMYTHLHFLFEHPFKGKIDTTLTIDYKYYITNNIPQKFEMNKVGNSSNGKYLVLYNITSKYLDPKDYIVYEITRVTNSEIEFTICKIPDDTTGSTGGKLIYRKKQ